MYCLRFDMTIVMLFMLTVCSAGSLLGQEADDSNIFVTVKGLTNDDLEWSGTYVGLIPRLSEAAKSVSESNCKCVLLELEPLLRDPDRFAIAHVLLTFIVPNRIDVEAPYNGAEQWLGLHVDLLADGSVTYNHEDIPVLMKKWRLIIHSEEHCVQANPRSERVRSVRSRVSGRDLRRGR